MRANQTDKARSLTGWSGNLAANLAALTLLCVLCTHCAMPNFEEFTDETSEEPGGQKSEPPEEILVESEELTLTWDPPASEVKEYKVLYRTHGTTGWTEKAVVPDTPSPAYTFYHSEMGNGAYDFAVVAVDDEDTESAVHSSLDPTASPSTGWYVLWQR